MKLIIAGATGLIGHELVRQSLQLSAITQVVALARKPIQIEASNSSKLKSVTIDDYGEYPEHIKTELAGADACIWYAPIAGGVQAKGPFQVHELTSTIHRTVGITPLKSTKMDFAEVKRVCQDCTLAGFKAICEAGPARPFRFVYFSGQGVPQDPGVVKKGFLGDYITMRVSASHPYNTMLHRLFLHLQLNFVC